MQSKIIVAMWLGELIVLLCFLGLGAALSPTAQSDAVAKRRGIEEATTLKRQTIQSSRAEYRARNPQSQRIFKSSIALLVLGFGLVMLFDIQNSGGTLSPLATFLVSFGWVLQVLSLVAILGVILVERRYIVEDLHRVGLGRRTK